MPQIKIIVEQHPDGFIAYPLGLKGGIVGEGDSYIEALENARSAIKFHIDTFGPEAFEEEQDVIEAFVDNYAVAA